MDINVGKDYISPHQVPEYIMYSGSSWDLWHQARERYATAPLGEEGDAERKTAMAELLSCVTEVNPPVHRIPLGRPGKTKTWHDIDGRPHEYVRAPRFRQEWFAPRVAVVILLVYAVVITMQLVWLP